MTEQDYIDMGIDYDAVVLNMNDLTLDSLYKIRNIVYSDAADVENVMAAKRIDAFISKHL